MAEEKDVTAAESSPAEANTETPAVTGAHAEARPVENWQGEFRRKQERTQQQLDAVLQWIATQATPQRQATYAPTPAQPQAADGDEELWARAQQGDRQAFELYQQRIAERTYRQQSATQGRTQVVQGQLNALLSRYPMLRDSSHPLTQVVNQYYQALLQSGYPAEPATTLDAIKTALADRPDLVMELHTQNAQARDAARRTATQTAQTGQMGGGMRQTPATPSTRQKPVTKEEIALANRMLPYSEKHHPDEKTPEQRVRGAKQRFLQRQEDGTSRLGAVSGFISGEDFS